jgi:crotonobetainyl-CoA:carnitine CoA-transferase CaiB-like acyl-CoA transferase
MYQCRDGRYVTVAAAEPRTWSALCTGLGLDDLATGRPGGDDADEVTRRLEEAFATRSAEEWVRELGPLGAAVGAVNRGADLLNDPHVQARGSLVRVGDTHVPASPIRLRSAAGERRGSGPVSVPVVGADTDDLLANAGFTGGEIADLRLAGVVGG